MMGRQSLSERLFSDFCLENHVPAQHPLRSLDRVLCFDDIRTVLASCYSHTGRPSIDPELLLRMMLVGYVYGIRSERRLCQEVRLNWAYRWFCRLGLEGSVPNHSTFSKNRYRRFQQSGLYRTLFDEVVRQCQQAGLVSGEGFAVDGTLIEADVNHTRHVPSAQELQRTIKPQAVSRPVQAYRDALNTCPSETDEPCRPEPARISVMDPQAAWCQKHKQARFGYYANYLIDTENAVIVGVEATPARPSQEVVAARLLLDRVQERHGLKPQRLAADKLYGSGAFLSWLLQRQVEPHIPVIDRHAQRRGILPRDAFTYDAAADAFTCPEGKTLPCFTISPERRHYKAKTEDCRGCPQKERCTQGAEVRRLTRHRDEAAREQVRALQKTDAFRKSARERQKVEMLFAHLKQQFHFRRLKLRGWAGAAEECFLAATVQNLRRLIRLQPLNLANTGLSSTT